MPLTLELYTEEQVVGRLVIDRSNLVIQFLPKDKSPKEIDLAIGRRDKFMYEAPFIELNCGADLKRGMDIDSPFHKITDHMCESDKEGYHTHMEFKKNIDLSLMQKILSLKSVWLNHISEDCYNYLCGVVNNYFLELSTSASAQAIEAEYRNEKDAQLKLAQRSLPRQQAVPTLDPLFLTLLGGGAAPILRTPAFFGAPVPNANRLQMLMLLLALSAFDASDDDEHTMPDRLSSYRSNR